MILFKKEHKQNLSLEFLLTKVSDFDIFKYYIHSFKKVGKVFCSEIRQDNCPSSTIYLGQDNSLHYKDFADSSVGGRAVDYVMIKYGLNFIDALAKIYHDFGITEEESNTDYKKITSKYCKPVLEQKMYSLIQVEVKAFSVLDLKYWGNYGICADDLKRENIWSVKSWCLNRKKQLINEEELCFVYVYPGLGYKIYYPMRPKKEKWIMNLNLKFIEGYDKIDLFEKVLITKSKKDKIFLQKLLPDFLVLALMNESISGFTPEVVEKLKTKCLWVNLDNDKTGKSSSWKITTMLNKPHLNVPDTYLSQNVTDFTDWFIYDGHDLAIKEFLTIKGLL